MTTSQARVLGYLAVLGFGLLVYLIIGFPQLPSQPSLIPISPLAAIITTGLAAGIILIPVSFIIALVIVAVSSTLFASAPHVWVHSVSRKPIHTASYREALSLYKFNPLPVTLFVYLFLLGMPDIWELVQPRSFIFTALHARTYFTFGLLLGSALTLLLLWLNYRLPHVKSIFSLDPNQLLRQGSPFLGAIEFVWPAIFLVHTVIQVAIWCVYPATSPLAFVQLLPIYWVSTVFYLVFQIGMPLSILHLIGRRRKHDILLAQQHQAEQKELIAWAEAYHPELLPFLRQRRRHH